MAKSPMETDIQVGRMVRMRRLMLGMSQTDLADELGITFQQVQKYEKGVNRISASRLQQIANFLHVRVTFFFDGSSDTTQQTKHAVIIPDEACGFLSTRDGLRLAEAYMRIRRRSIREAVVRLVEDLQSYSPSKQRKSAVRF